MPPIFIFHPANAKLPSDTPTTPQAHRRASGGINGTFLVHVSHTTLLSLFFIISFPAYLFFFFHYIFS
jgi:hypothetical protein